MNYDVALTILIPVIAICAFFFLAKTMRSAWSSPMDRKGASQRVSWKSLNLKHPLPHSDCYDDCMNESHWDAARIPACVSACGL